MRRGLYKCIVIVLCLLSSYSNAWSDNTVPLPPTNQRVFPKRLSAPEFRFASAQQIIMNKCVTCHRLGGIGTNFVPYIQSEAAWVSANLVVPQNSRNSVLYRYLQGSGLFPATMPIGGSLSTPELATIREWIDAMQDPSTAPTPTPTATPPPGDNRRIGINPSQTVPRLGSREFVKSVLDKVFGPSAAVITSPEVFDRISIFGGVCDAMGEPPTTGSGEDQCSNVDVSTYSAPIIPSAFASRSGRSMQACNRILFATNEEALQYAIRAATGRTDLSYLATNPIPTSTEIIAAYLRFNPARQNPAQSVVDRLTAVAQATRETGKPRDPWRYVLLTLCYDPAWQVQ